MIDKMSVRQDVAKRKRKCTLCGCDINKGETCIHFSSGGYGGRTTENNVCIRCIKDIARENTGMMINETI